MLDKAVVEEIYSSHLSEKEKLHSCVETYVTVKPNSSFKQLVDRLYDCGEMAAAKEAKSFLPQNDKSLTIENVANVMENVTVDQREKAWKSILDWRGEFYVRKVYSSGSTEKDKILACSDVYVHSRPDSSWEHLTTVLYKEEEMTAVDWARPFLPPRDLTVTTDKLMQLFQSVQNVDRVGGLNIGRWLGLPKSAVEEIKRNFQNTTQRKEAYLDTYTHHHPFPVWTKIADVLRACNLYQQAKQIKETYVQVSERTRHNFDNAMADGNLMIRCGSVFFLGAGGSGKSHTVAILLDEEPPSLRESTPCAKTPIRSIAQYKVGISGVRFVRIKEDEYCDMLSMSTKRFECTHLSRTTTLPQAPSRQQEEIIELTTEASQLTSNVATTTKQGDSELHPMKSKQKAHVQGSGLEIELLRRMQATPKSSEDLNDKDLMDMRDSGGQPSFHEVLPLFVTNTTFGVLTVKLNESLDAYPLVEYYTNGNPIGEPFNSPFTHLQTLSHCMRVLQSTCDRKSCPKIVFVGTHKDLEHECKPKESRRTKNEKLQKIIPPAMKDSVIYCDSSLQELIFAINVKEPVDEDRETAGYVRQLMIEELRKTPKQKVPMQYFALENAFIRLAKYKRKGVLSKEECFQEATAFHFTRESFEAALRYLHSLKLIFYYEKVLPDVVFIDAQTLLDTITEIVEYRLTEQSRKVTATGALEEFKAYGIVTLELLSKFTTHYVPNVFTPKELVLLLKHLRVLAEVGEGKYLVPCLLNVVDIPHPSPHLAIRSISTLLFYFGPDGPKLGVYCCLIASLITEAKWELVTENNRPVQVSRNQVQFRLPGDDPGAITITDAFSTFFHVSIGFPEKVSEDKAHQICCNLCPSIRERILTEIRKASQKLNYNNSIPKMAFPCSEHQTTDLHPATVSSTGLLTCTTHPTSVCSELTEQHKVWLGKMNTGDSGSGHAAEEADASTASISPTAVIDASPTLAKLSYWRTTTGKIRIIKKIAPCWEKLGDLLDFDPSGAQLAIIDKKYPRDSEACCRAMFQYWLKGNGVKPCSWQTLIELLEACDQEALAKEIQEALMNN